eukprot:scaffold601564_cov18-Prasinocladus_malaysianus.AAC.1
MSPAEALHKESHERKVSLLSSGYQTHSNAPNTCIPRASHSRAGLRAPPGRWSLLALAEPSASFVRGFKGVCISTIPSCQTHREAQRCHLSASKAESRVGSAV